MQVDVFQMMWESRNLSSFTYYTIKFHKHHHANQLCIMRIFQLWMKLRNFIIQDHGFGCKVMYSKLECKNLSSFTYCTIELHKHHHTNKHSIIYTPSTSEHGLCALCSPRKKLRCFIAKYNGFECKLCIVDVVGM